MVKIELSKREIDIFRELLIYSTEAISGDYFKIFNRRTGKNMNLSPDEAYNINKKLRCSFSQNTAPKEERNNERA